LLDKWFYFKEFYKAQNLEPWIKQISLDINILKSRASKFSPNMKIFSDWYITTKLLLINLVVLLIIGGVIVVVFFSFNNIEQMMTTIVNRDVSQVIENARIGRGLTGVFADTSHLIDRFLDQEDLLQTEGDRLVETTTALVTRSTDPRLGESLQAFIQKLQALLEQGAIISKMSQELNATDQELVSNLEELEELLANTIIVVRMEGRDVSGLEQIRLDIPWYREALLRVNISLYQIVQKHLRVALTEKEVSENILRLLVLLDGLDAKLQPLTTSEPAIKAFGQQFVDTVRNYKKTIAAFYKELTTFQQQLNTMNAAQQQVLAAMEEIDAQIGQATENMQNSITGAMLSSRILVLVLSGIIVIVMILGWLGMRWMIRPLIPLSQIAEQLADGDINCNLQTLRRTTSTDEIGILSRAFMRLVTYIQAMATIATEISRGNLSQTTQPKSERDVLGHAFQNMSAYLNKMATAATTIAGGDIRQDIQPKTEDDVLGNTFKELIAYIQANAQVAEQLSHGDLSVNVTVLSDKDVLGKSFNRMVETLKAIMTEINVLIGSAVEGKLTVRGEVEQFEGEYARIVTGINATLDAVIGPLMIAADYMRRIAIGDFPEPLTEEYKGDFNTIKENLNLLIKASHDVTRLAEEMASGNLLVELRERSTHDTLMRALNTMIHQLKNVVINVKAAADNVATSSEELSSSAEMTSQGASQQASAAEEASTSMEQMVSNIRQNADNARQTEQIALQSTKYAEEGSNVIGETVVVMQQIAQKITIIKEIADQTRMLSLNATIEAARAQEHGKAFSVVAAEVRKLSDVTKKAAEQIDQLAASSLDVSERAAQMLDTLVPSIHRTAELVQEITAASSEQSIGAEHVNAAIHQLDLVTQQNAASADEIASTAETMATQANQLQHTIEFFKIGETVSQPIKITKPLGESIQPEPSPEDIVDNTRPKVEKSPKQGDKTSSGCLLDLDQPKESEDERDAEFERY
jgi:methyl-accepting chemotaxis protein